MAELQQTSVGLVEQVAQAAVVPVGRTVQQVALIPEAVVALARVVEQHQGLVALASSSLATWVTLNVLQVVS